MTNSINSKVAKVTFNLIFLHSLGEDPEIVNHVFFFPHPILSHYHGGNMGLALLETLGVKILQGVQNLNVSQTCAINGTSLGWQRNAKERCGHSAA